MSSENLNISESISEIEENKSKGTCGIIMPISAIDGCTSDHWKEVLIILKETINDTGFEVNLVSEADDIGIIQKRIIHNLYNNSIVVCDVSGKNPNVMFELGMRLAFDKPTIIIKDDITSYSFDTAPIEHLEYPRDLRYSKINDFKKNLKDKVIATFQKSNSDPNYTTFLKHFGDYKVTEISKVEVSTEKYILEAIEDVRREVRQMRASTLKAKPFIFSNDTDYKLDVLKKLIKTNITKVESEIGQGATIDHSELIRQRLLQNTEISDALSDGNFTYTDFRRIIEDILFPF